jgi:hypothetical protein
MLLLLTSCQNSGHKFGADTLHAQFSSQNPLAYPITNSDLISKVLNGSTSILTNELLKLGNSVGRCAADGPICVLVVLNGCPTGPKPSMPFKRPCTAHAFCPECLSNYCQGLHRTFSEICIKCCPHSRFLCRIHREIASQDLRKKNQYVQPAARNFVRYASTTIYRCIALLQLLYRWQHKSRKLWIPLIITGLIKKNREWICSILDKLCYTDVTAMNISWCVTACPDMFTAHPFTSVICNQCLSNVTNDVQE